MKSHTQESQKKICTKCNVEKLSSEFSVKKASKKDGLDTKCKSCKNAEHAVYREKNAEKIKTNKAIFYQENKIEIKEKKKIYRSLNKEKIAITNKIWRGENKEYVYEKHKEWKKINKEYAKQKHKEWCDANPDKVKDSKKKSYQKNKKNHNAATEAWRKKNPDYSIAKNQNRRARKMGNGGKLSKGLRKKLFELQRGHCAICKKKLSKAARQQHMDHVIPLVLGGPNEDWNMQLLCQPCNNKKGAQDPIEYMQSLNFLL